jgi:hypothetical protein
MAIRKRNRLVTRPAAEREPQLVPIEEFSTAMTIWDRSAAICRSIRQSQYFAT